MGSFEKLETNLNQKFLDAGFSKEIAEAVARAFTKYSLGYVTAEGVANIIITAGAEKSDALAIANMFQDVVENVTKESLPAQDRAHC